MNKLIPMLKEGDTFIRISKYGHVFGIVKSIGSKTIQSIDLKCSYTKPTVISTNGIEYDMNECYKVNKQYNEQELQNLINLVERIKKGENHTNWNEALQYMKDKKKLDNL